MRHARRRERSRLVRLWRLWATADPVTFTEKVRYKMLRDHRQLMVTFADKAATRAYVASVLGPGFLPAVYAILDEPAELATVQLPAEYVVKPTHGSGAVVVVSHTARADSVLPPLDACWSYTHVQPHAVDRAHLVGVAQFWVEQLYGRGPNREWAYGSVPRRVIVEELLGGPGDGIAHDYKFFVFHGRCEFVQVDAGRFGFRSQDFFRRPWTHLSLSGGPPHAHPAAPEQLDQMIDIAQRLSQETDFLRVDLYIVGSRIVVGELTSLPAGGDSPFDPVSFDEEFGRLWTVPRYYSDSESMRSQSGASAGRA